MGEYIDGLFKSIKQNPDITIIIVAVTMCVVGMTVLLEIEDEYQYNETYCANVHAYENNNGLYGWPDYKGIYDRVCK